MKRNIMISTLSIALVASIAFGVYQKIRADKLEEKINKELLLNIDKENRVDELMNRLIKVDTVKNASHSTKK